VEPDSGGLRNLLSRLVVASRLGSMASPVASLAVSTIVGAAASFTGVVFLARLLDLREFGQIVFAQASSGIIFSVLDPRVEDGVIKFVPMIEARAGGGASTCLFRRALFVDEALGGSFALVIVAGLLSPVFHVPSATTMPFLAIAIIQGGVQSAIGTASAGFAVTDGLALLGWTRVVASVVTTAASIVGLLIGGGVAYMVVQAVSAGVLTLVLSVLALRRVARLYGRAAELPRGAAKGFVRFTIKSSLAATVSIGTDKLPLAIVGNRGSVSLLAEYRVALAPSRLVAAAFSPVAAVMFPMLSRDAAASELSRIRSRILSWTALLSLLALIGGVVAWFLIPVVLPLLFGKPYGAAAKAAWILTCAALLRGSVVWAKVLPLALGRSGLKLIVTIVDAALVTSAAWWGATRGLQAIAWSQLGVAILYVGIWIVLALNLSRIDLTPYPSADVGAAMEELAGGDNSGPT
jgi:O-antigen/teichoic acid export membrane protein